MTISADDGVNSAASATFTITIRNTPPVITDPGDKSYEQGESITGFNITVVDSGDSPTVTVSGLPGGLSYVSGQVSGLIDSNVTARDYTVTISADDGVNPVVSATFTITVTPNNPPVITNPGNKSYKQGETITPFNVTVTDSEDTPTVTLSGLPSGLSYRAGQVSGSINSNAAARDYTVTISANDEVNPAVSATFVITIARNNPPVITNPGNKSYERSETITGFNIMVIDAEDRPTVTLSGLPSGLSYTSGRVSGTISSVARDYVVTIFANDGVNPAVSSTFTITVTPRAWPVDNAEGDWSVRTGTDSLTKMEQVRALLRPRGSTGIIDEYFVVRCGYDEDGEVEALVRFDSKLAEEWYRLEVRYRFDDNPIEAERWGLSTNYYALFAQSPIEFIWQMMHSQELVIREEGGQTLIFDVSGLANALYPHRDKCNWIEPWHN